MGGEPRSQAWSIRLETSSGATCLASHRPPSTRVDHRSARGSPPFPRRGSPRDTGLKYARSHGEIATRGPLPQPFPRLGGRVASRCLRNGPSVSKRLRVQRILPHTVRPPFAWTIAPPGVLHPSPEAEEGRGEGGHVSRIRLVFEPLSEMCPDVSPTRGTGWERGPCRAISPRERAQFGDVSRRESRVGGGGSR